MSEPNTRPVYQRMLIIVTREEEQRRLESVFDAQHVPICFQTRGKGTAPSEIMDIFGLRGTTRLLTVGLLPRFRVREVFRALAGAVPFYQRGGGIAITVPVNGLQSHVHQFVSEEAFQTVAPDFKWEESEMKEKSEYVLVWVSVANGFSDEVVDAARDAGARGGTVIKGRRRNSERASEFFGIPTQEEQDFVMIVVPREKKSDVMGAINRACGLSSEAHGVVLSLPVDEAMGLA
ncbi:MAG: transcriptional regulator [Oscillospiraceae bacterium]|nr:transcriptional regulator [Oscillospiraceae bacterium]